MQRGLFSLGLALPGGLLAGGSGVNVVVVVNQHSTNSVQLGNYYCELRHVPPQNLLRITNWTGGNVQWTTADFTNCLLNPLRTMLAHRQLTNQIEYVLLSMDFPYRVVQGGAAGSSGTNSTTSALFYGFKPDGAAVPASCSLPAASSNAYAGTEAIFRTVSQFSTNTNSFLACMLTATNLVRAKALVDQGVASDGAWPTQWVYLGKSPDPWRNIRYVLFDNAIINAHILGRPNILRTNSGNPWGLQNLLGFETGVQNFGIWSNTFVPGALADSLTSFGGAIFETQHGHTTLFEFIHAGASGSYGTVVEPCAYLAKFPNPQVYFYQGRGFSLAECYYQSITNPYQGLLVGEPLAAPFARPPHGAWSNLPFQARLSGTTNLSLQFTAAGPNRPVQQVDLFLDGTWVQTLTNLAPRQGNILYVTLNGFRTNYTVGANQTIRSVASNLTVVLNTPSYTNATKVLAYAHGDRIELRSQNPSASGAQVSLSVSNAIGTASLLTTFIEASRTNFLDTGAYGLRGFTVSNAPLANDYLRLTITKTNGTPVTVAVTNLPATNTVSTMVNQLVNLVNSNAVLQADDGVAAEDFIGYDPYGLAVAKFNLRARAVGWPAAQVQAALTGSPTFALSPSGTVRLEENLGDLQPRNHLYVTAGLTNLAFTFVLDTTKYPDGYHELTAVAYEGSHVRTQKRVAQSVRMTNSPLAATVTALLGDTNTAREATLQFAVVANTNNISKIELFSTGGSLGVVSNQSSATFSVPGTNLDLGLHPFYAVVTAAGGKQYRTETKWFRLVGPTGPFSVQPALTPLRILWTAVAGRRYEVLSADSLTSAFQLRGSVTPTNCAGVWIEPNPTYTQRFYRVRVAP